jgi:hypothetical protein
MKSPQNDEGATTPWVVVLRVGMRLVAFVVMAYDEHEDAIRRAIADARRVLPIGCGPGPERVMERKLKPGEAFCTDLSRLPQDDHDSIRDVMDRVHATIFARSGGVGVSWPTGECQ